MGLLNWSGTRTNLSTGYKTNDVTLTLTGDSPTTFTTTGAHTTSGFPYFTGDTVTFPSTSDQTWKYDWKIDTAPFDDSVFLMGKKRELYQKLRALMDKCKLRDEDWADWFLNEIEPMLSMLDFCESAI